MTKLGMIASLLLAAAACDNNAAGTPNDSQGPAGPAGPQGPAGPMPTLPSCTPGQVLSSDGTQLTCVTATPSRALYVGNTTAVTNGRIQAAGTPTGLRSAAKLCSYQFGAGAHMCTMQELYDSVLSGALNENNTMAAAWIYFPSWNEPTAGAALAGNGQADNCAGYTYPTADLKWQGMTASWDTIAATSAKSLIWKGGSQASCNMSLPIACCKAPMMVTPPL